MPIEDLLAALPQEVLDKTATLDDSSSSATESVSDNDDMSEVCTSV